MSRYRHGFWFFDACCERLRPGATAAYSERWEAYSFSHYHFEGACDDDDDFQIRGCDLWPSGQAAVWTTASVLRSPSLDGITAIFVNGRSASHYDYQSTHLAASTESAHSKEYTHD